MFVDVIVVTTIIVEHMFRNILQHIHGLMLKLYSDGAYYMTTTIHHLKGFYKHKILAHTQFRDVVIRIARQCCTVLFDNI